VCVYYGYVYVEYVYVCVYYGYVYVEYVYVCVYYDRHTRLPWLAVVAAASDAPQP
jgi:hypothetical protein